jgi:hypothetical protein
MPPCALRCRSTTARTEDARKGFIDTLPDAVITNAQRVVWTPQP